MSAQSNLTPAEVVGTLSTIGKDIDTATDDLARADEEVVKCRRLAETEYARVFLNTDGPMEVRRYTARLATESENFALEIAEQKHRAITSHIRALRDRLEIGRSISAIMRMEWANQ